MIPFLQPDCVVSIDFEAGVVTVDWDPDFERKSRQPSPACGRGRREAPGEGAAFDVAGQKPGPHPNPSPAGGRGATDRSISSARYEIGRASCRERVCQYV